MFLTVVRILGRQSRLKNKQDLKPNNPANTAPFVRSGALEEEDVSAPAALTLW
jgi:hypothetical protein